MVARLPLEPSLGPFWQLDQRLDMDTTRHRLRMRFRKEGDLRLISHRDLVRAFERWFRRCALRLRMSQGFHPKPKMTFPLALALGIAGAREVMEFELTEPADARELRCRLAAQAPPGLEIVELHALEPGQKKARVRRVTYEVPIPLPHRETVRERINQFGRQTSIWIQREKSGREVDLKTGSDHLELQEGSLHFRLLADCPVSVRPREVLQALGIADLEHEGCYLTRTEVEIVA
jgi:radical SAM-linked protein